MGETETFYAVINEDGLILAYFLFEENAEDYADDHGNLFNQLQVKPCAVRSRIL